MKRKIQFVALVTMLFFTSIIGTSFINTPKAHAYSFSTAWSITQESYKYIGVKYIHGGKTPSAFDCSGFVYYLFNKHGVSLPRQSAVDYYWKGKFIYKWNLVAGDLVFFSVNTPKQVNHIGIYLGNGKFISALPANGVTITSMNSPYWSSRYMGAKRI